MSNVLRLVPPTLSADDRLDADAMLEDAKGEEFTTLMIIGQYADGSMYLMSNCNRGETLFLMEQVKHKIVFGDQ